MNQLWMEFFFCVWACLPTTTWCSNLLERWVTVFLLFPSTSLNIHHRKSLPRAAIFFSLSILFCWFWFDIVGRRRVIDKRTTAGARVCVCVCVCGDSRRRCQRFRRHYRPDSGLHHRNRDSSMTADYGTAAEERHPRGSWSAVETCRSLKKNKPTIERDERWGKWKKKMMRKKKGQRGGGRHLFILIQNERKSDETSSKPRNHQ